MMDIGEFRVEISAIDRSAANVQALTSLTPEARERIAAMAQSVALAAVPQLRTAGLDLAFMDRFRTQCQAVGVDFDVAYEAYRKLSAASPVSVSAMDAILRVIADGQSTSARDGQQPRRDGDEAI
jgi:hypothetical protein